jgi:hypothetical protein
MWPSTAAGRVGYPVRVGLAGPLVALLALLGAGCLAVPGASDGSDAAPTGPVPDADPLAPDAEVAPGGPAPLLDVRFEDSTTDEAGVEPSVSANVTFTDGRAGRGAMLEAPADLAYPNSVIDLAAGTIEMWVRPSWAGNDGKSHHFVSWGHQGGFAFVKDGANNLRFIVNRLNLDSSGDHPEKGVGVSVSGWIAGDWHHIAASWEEDVLLLYLDGAVRDVDFRPSLAPNAALVTIGVDTGAGAGTKYADAVIDELRIHPVALTAEQVAASHAALATP